MKEYKSIEIVSPEAEDKGKRLDAFLEERLEGVTRSYIKKLIEDGDVVVENKSKIKSGLKLKGNENITVKTPVDQMLDIEAEDLPIDIVFEDEHMVVINKAPGIVVHPAPGNYTGTLVNAVMYHIKDLSSINGVVRPGIVHRLDKDTSGVIIIAKHDEAHMKLTEMFKEKTIDKTYICICKGRIRADSGRIENMIGRSSKDRKKMAVVERDGKIAITNYKILDRTDKFSLVEVGIETGRTHQIRVHMRSINHTILGDGIYGAPSKSVDRQMLHAYKLEFKHPMTGKKMSVTADIPEDFRAVSKRLGLDLETVTKTKLKIKMSDIKNTEV